MKNMISINTVTGNKLYPFYFFINKKDLHLYLSCTFSEHMTTRPILNERIDTYPNLPLLSQIKKK